jgi:hypothetical protein
LPGGLRGKIDEVPHRLIVGAAARRGTPSGPIPRALVVSQA